MGKPIAVAIDADRIAERYRLLGGLGRRLLPRRLLEGVVGSQTACVFRFAQGMPALPR